MTSSRARGTNPRSKGTNPRAQHEPAPALEPWEGRNPPWYVALGLGPNDDPAVPFPPRPYNRALDWRPPEPEHRIVRSKGRPTPK